MADGGPVAVEVVDGGPVVVEVAAGGPAVVEVAVDGGQVVVAGEDAVVRGGVIGVNIPLVDVAGVESAVVGVMEEAGTGGKYRAKLISSKQNDDEKDDKKEASLFSSKRTIKTALHLVHHSCTVKCKCKLKPLR